MSSARGVSAVALLAIGVVFGEAPVRSAPRGVYALRTGSGPAIQRAVFFDSTYVKAATVRQPDFAARYFANRGYQTLDAAALVMVRRAFRRHHRARPRRVGLSPAWIKRGPPGTGFVRIPDDDPMTMYLTAEGIL